MAQNWKPIDLMDVVGMASNPVDPGTKYAKRLLNVYTHEKPGELTLRPGYAPKYLPPSDNTITNAKVVNFAPFFDRQADPNGVEIICNLQKGILSALKDDLDQPIVPNTLKGLWFWVRPYWNGTQWINNWEWTNKTIITKITAIDNTYKSHIKIFGNLSHGLKNDSLIGWTIYNVTKQQFARILTCKLESPHLWLNITLYNNNWQVDDVIICSRGWIDVEEQNELYDNVEKEDITFHRINHDLRIGFGGKPKRPGIAIGYRKFYYQISEIKFPLLHADLLENGVLEKFSKIDGIYLDKHIMNTKDVYGLELETEEEGLLNNSAYYFRLTGQADYYTEQLVAENAIITQNNQKIIVSPFTRLGKDNLRLTGMKIYFSTDNKNFYKARTYNDIKKNNFDNPTQWIIDAEGRLIIKLNSGTELNQEASAVSTVNEQNSFGSWTTYDFNGNFLINNEAANQGNYSFKMELNAYGGTVPINIRKGIKLPLNGLKQGGRYTVSCYLKTLNDDLYEDFEDTNYIPGFTNGGFVRTNTGNPINNWHLFKEASQGPKNTSFPEAPYLLITVNEPTKLEFYLRGHVSVYKKIGGGNPIFIKEIISEGNVYTDANKQIVEINEGNTTNVSIYIVHEPDYYTIDNNMYVGVWSDCFIDNITIKINPVNFYAFLCGESLSLNGVIQKTLGDVTINYKKFTFDLYAGNKEVPKYLVIATTPKETLSTIFWIDEVSIKLGEVVYFDKTDLDNPGQEISEEMGYTPTYDLVKGWDKTLLKDGRAYYLNPYVDKRYENFLLVSHIAPPAIYMYDIASFDNFRELEKYDSNKTVNIELLPNKEILILKDSSVTTLSDDGRVGISREPIYGIDCISTNSVVNINGSVFWCGKEEIYSFNIGRSFVPEPMLKNTIRDLYLAIEDKTKIYGTRNRFNTYRIRINDPEQKTEYLLTENGWVEERKWHFPEIYRIGFNNKLYFLNNGIIYEEQVDFSLPIIPYGEETDE